MVATGDVSLFDDLRWHSETQQYSFNCLHYNTRHDFTIQKEQQNTIEHELNRCQCFSVEILKMCYINHTQDNDAKIAA